MADPAAAAVRDVPQRPQRLRRVRGPGERDGRRRPRLLRPLLRARQRRPRHRRRLRSRAGHGPGAEALRRRPASRPSRSVRTSTSRRRRPSVATSTSTRSRPRPRSPWAGGCPTRTTSMPTSRSSSSARCSRPATRPGCAGGWCSRTGSPATSAPTSAFMEDAFDVRNPTAFLVEAHHGGDVPADRVVAAIDEELDRVATEGVPDDELERVRARLGSAVLQGQDHVLSRTLAMAAFEQQRGRAELTGELAGLLGDVTSEQVAAAAGSLRPDQPGPSRHRCRGWCSMSPKRKAFEPREVPGLGRPRKPRLPTVAERVLPSGLRVVAVRRPSVPLVHLRLRIPSAVRRDAGPRPRRPARAHDAAGHRRARPGRAGRDAATHRRLAAGQRRRRPDDPRR